MSQPVLCRAALGDIGDRAGHARRNSIAAADRQPTAEHPQPAPVRVAHPALDLEVLAAPGQLAVDRGAELKHVIRMNQIEPASGVRVLVGLLEAEDDVPAVRQVDPVG